MGNQSSSAGHPFVTDSCDDEHNRSTHGSAGIVQTVLTVAEYGARAYTDTKVEVVGRMEAVVQQRDAAPAGQLQHPVERVLMWLRPDGWQARARRNAWSAMVADSQRRQSRMLVAREIGPVVAPETAEIIRAR